MSDGQRRVRFRWGLIRPDQLGSLVEDTPAPDLWFLDFLAECAGKVVARSGGGELVCHWTRSPGHIADYQVKLHRSLRPKHWVAEVDPPDRDEATQFAS